MTQTLDTQQKNTWEKPQNAELDKLTHSGGRWKFMVGGLLILGAIGYLVISSTMMGATFFITVDDLLNDPEYVGQNVRISGAVIGDTIVQETVLVSNRTSERNAIRFTVSHIPEEFDNLAEALNQSVTNPDATRLEIYYEGPMPDLLQHEAQAIMTGSLGEDGVFYANELLLKCPSCFEGDGSNQQLGEDHPGMAQIDAG